MQHSLFLWWVLWVVLALAGTALGVFCALTARHYERLLRAGSVPDGTSLADAVRAALHEPLLPIIWVDEAGRADAMLLMAGLLGGVMLAGLYVRQGAGLTFGLVGLAILVLLMLSCIDAQVGLLPDALTQPLLWVGLAHAWLGAGIDIHAALTGVFTGYILVQLPRWLWWRLRQQECLGAGDVKLLAALGAWTGAWGAVHILTLACLAGSVFTMLHQRRLRPTGSYPFGPFLALAWMADFLAPSGLQSIFYV